MEEFTSRNELTTVISSLFTVFLFFGFFIRFFGFFAGVVDGVDFVHILFRNFFNRKVCAFFREYFRELIVGIVNGRKKPEIFRANLHGNIGNFLEFHGVIRDNLMTDFAVFRVVYKHENFVDTAVLNCKRLLFRKLFASVC